MVSKHGSTLGFDEQCVYHAFMLVAYMCSLFLLYMYFLHIMVVFIVIVVSLCGSGWCVVGCGHHKCMSDVNAFVLHVRIYMLLCMHYHGKGCCR